MSVDILKHVQDAITARKQEAAPGVAAALRPICASAAAAADAAPALLLDRSTAAAAPSWDPTAAPDEPSIPAVKEPVPPKPLKPGTSARIRCSAASMLPMDAAEPSSCGGAGGTSDVCRVEEEKRPLDCMWAARMSGSRAGLPQMRVSTRRSRCGTASSAEAWQQPMYDRLHSHLIEERRCAVTCAGCPDPF